MTTEVSTEAMHKLAFIPRPWKKGESGNPGGISKHRRMVLELATKDGARMTQKGWKYLEDIIDSPSAKFSDKIECIKIVFDRVYGKPRQSAELKVQHEALPPIVQILLSGKLPDQSIDVSPIPNTDIIHTKSQNVSRETLPNTESGTVPGLVPGTVPNLAPDISPGIPPDISPGNVPNLALGISHAFSTVPEDLVPIIDISYLSTQE